MKDNPIILVIFGAMLFACLLFTYALSQVYDVLETQNRTIEQINKNTHLLND